jgi:serine/threonine protein phosphatase PrpC
MKLSIEARTDVGLVRELNEDSYRVLPEHNAVVVCDGMGGHAAGEVASARAADSISDLVSGGLSATTGSIKPVLDKPWPDEAVMLAAAVRLANRRLYNDASRSHKLRGMGTTVVAAVFVPGAIATAHVGDSRAYKIANGAIEQLTTDHSWVAELIESGQVKPEDAETFADKNVITRALGTRPGVQVDIGVHPVVEGELYLLCSDGLCGYVSDEDILKLVLDNPDDLQAAAVALVDAANAAGGLDNSTVALVRVDGTSVAEAELEPGTVTLPEESETELTNLDTLINERYSEEPPKGADETTDSEGRKKAAEAAAAKSGGKNARWILLLILIGMLFMVVIWPRLRNGSESDPAKPTEAGVPADHQVIEADLALLFIAPGSADRSAQVFWDGVQQGTLRELELGLLVDPGEHVLHVVSVTGDTLLSEVLSVAPNDTLDLEVP